LLRQVVGHDFIVGHFYQDANLVVL
jgi:hypothetical protein